MMNDYDDDNNDAMNSFSSLRFVKCMAMEAPGRMSQKAEV